MKFLPKVVVNLFLLSLIIGLIFYDNVKGYYRFKEYCEKEGGLRVYEKLERNMGWLSENKYSAMTVAQFDYVDFSKYIDPTDGKSYEVQFKGGIPLNETSYNIVSVENNSEPRYFFKTKQFNVEGELRLNLYAEEIYSVKTNALLVRYFIYGYELFDRAHTLLDMPSEEKCYLGDPGSAITGSALDVKMIKSAFKN